MFRNNIAFKGICTIILFITMGISQVSLTIENVNTTAGTLDLNMTNTAGCSSCDDPLYDNQIGCEANGWNNGTGVWMFAASVDETTCETMNGVYFDGQIKGFQFYLKGITITGVSGGTAEQYLDFVQFTTTGSGKIVGTSFGANFIPVGADAILTTISF